MRRPPPWLMSWESIQYVVSDELEIPRGLVSDENRELFLKRRNVNLQTRR